MRDQLLGVTKSAANGLPAHVTGYTYDNAKRKLSEANDGRQIIYQYDNGGNRTRLTWPDGYYATYQYDALNRMTYALQNGSTELANYSYDTLSRRNYACFGGQSVACQGGGGTNKEAYLYEPDSDINTFTQTLNSISVSLGLVHNHSHQIASLSANDNFYLPGPVATITSAYVPGVLNQYTSVAGNTLQYDINGNLLKLFPGGGAQTFSYDSENRLTSAAVGGAGTASIFYDYDAKERRVTKTVGGTALGSGGTTTNYLTDGQEEIAELDGSGNVLRRYIPGPSIDDRIAVAEGSSTTAPTLTYFHVNHQGSVIAMTDGAGNAIGCVGGVNCQRLSYDEYGNLTSYGSNTGEPYRFTGRRFDSETGLYYYRARYYSPQLGRFMQLDPVGSKDDLNLYAYVGNDPVDKSDPTGLLCQGEGDKSSCSIDYLNGKAFDRDATKKSNPKLEAKIEKFEKNLTKSYVAAQNLGKGTITVKGDPSHGIADTKVSGARIAGEMSEATFTAETRASAQPVSSSGAEVLGNADRSTHNINVFNGTLNAPANAYGSRVQQDVGVHEAMHFVPYLSGWTQSGLSDEAHEGPFREAIDQLLGPWPNR